MGAAWHSKCECCSAHCYFETSIPKQNSHGRSSLKRPCVACHDRARRGPHFGRPSFNYADPRTAMSAFISWEDSDWQVNTLHDSIDIIDPDKLQQTGETTLLTLLVLSREVDY